MSTKVKKKDILYVQFVLNLFHLKVPIYMLLSYFSVSVKVNYDYFKIYPDEMKFWTQENIHQIPVLVSAPQGMLFL